VPELPEVETIRLALERFLRAERIAGVKTGRSGLRVPFPKNLKSRLVGKTVQTVRRRGKYIRMDLDDGSVLVIHLGMSGHIRLFPKEEPFIAKKHDHFFLSFENGTNMVLNDPRRFGMVLLFDSGEAFENFPAFRSMGPEPLGNGFSTALLAEKLKNKQSPIKTALLDQKLVAGLGNIYVCEVLFQAGIDPRRKAKSLSAAEIERLVPSIRDVLLRAIAAGGSSLKDYKHTDDTLGYFQHHFAVYDREAGPCKDCCCRPEKTGGVKRIVQAGRSTFYCPQKQK